MTQKCEKNLSTIYYLDTHYIIFVLCCTSETVSLNKFPSILLFSLFKSIFKQFLFQHIQIHFLMVVWGQFTGFLSTFTSPAAYRAETRLRIAVIMVLVSFWPPPFFRCEFCWQVHMHCTLSHQCLLTQFIPVLVTGIFWCTFQFSFSLPFKVRFQEPKWQSRAADCYFPVPVKVAGGAGRK